MVKKRGHKLSFFHVFVAVVVVIWKKLVSQVEDRCSLVGYLGSSCRTG